VRCGDSLCPIDGGGACCINRIGSDKCAPPNGEGCGDLSWGESEVTCDGPEDCAPSEICCGDIQRGQTQYDTYYKSLRCSSSCDTEDAILCGERPEECPDQMTCGASNYLPDGYNVCQQDEQP